MEIEFFCHPNASRKWYEYWRDRRMKWYTDLGLAGERLATARAPRRRTEPLLDRHGRHRIRFPVLAAGRVRRARGHRSSRRLRPPQPHGRQARSEDAIRLTLEKDGPDGKPRWRGSGKDLSYFATKTNERFIPHVIEPSAGADRGDARVPVRGLHRGRSARRERQAADPRGDEVPSADRADQGGRVPAGEERQHARAAPISLPRGGPSTPSSPRRGAGPSSPAESARGHAPPSDGQTLTDGTGSQPATTSISLRSVLKQRTTDN